MQIYVSLLTEQMDLELHVHIYTYIYIYLVNVITSIFNLNILFILFLNIFAIKFHDKSSFLMISL